MRAGVNGEETLAALKQGLSHYDMDGVHRTCDATPVFTEFPDGCSGGVAGSRAADATLGVLMLQKISDVLRVGDGTVFTAPPYVCYGETVGDGISAIKEYTTVCATGSIGTGTAEEWRGGIPHKAEGGKGALMISVDLTIEQKSVARGLLLDPRGGDNISTGGGKIVTNLLP